MSSPAAPKKTLNLFISYAHEDSDLRDRLVKHLSPLARRNLITPWYDGKIVAGEEWEQQILDQLGSADIVLLLISADFMASDYIYANEMKLALARHETGQARVIPVLLRPVAYDDAPFARLEALPTDSRKNLRAVTKWPNRDEAFAKIAAGVRKAVEQLSGAAAVTVAPPDLARALYQLRAPVINFVGREKAIGELVSGIREALPGGATALICGLGGLGKTELAYVVARQLEPEFPDAQLLVELRGTSDEPLSRQGALLKVIQSFDPRAQVSDDLDRLQARYRAELHDKRVLILVDDAADAEQVRRLMPPAGCALLVTSRRCFGLPGALVRDLEALSESAAVELLTTICPRIGAAAPRLAQLCDYLPLALRVSASLLANDATRDVEQYVQALADERWRLPQSKDPDDSTPDVDPWLWLGYQALRPEAQAALRQFSVFPSSFDRAAAQAVINLRDLPAKPAPAARVENPPGAAQPRQRGRAVPPGFDDVLSSLYLRSWLESDPDTQRYNLHDVVRTFAAAQLTPSEEGRLRGYATYYAGVATMAEALYEQGGEHMLEGLALFDRERIHIDAGWNWARSHADDELLLRYASAMGYIWGLRYHPRRERIPQGEQALAAAQRLRRRWDEGNALTILGNAYGSVGEARRAIEYENRALEIARSIRERYGEEASLGNLGSSYLDLGNTRQAIQYFEQAQQIARSIKDRRGESKGLDRLGLAYIYLGQAQRAVEFLEQSLAIARQIGRRDSEGAALGNLGRAHIDLGETTQARALCEQSLKIKQELGDRRDEGYALNFLGVAYAAAGESQRAQELQEQALMIAREVEDRFLEARVLNDLGEVCLGQGEVAQAMERLEQAQALAKAIDAQQIQVLSGWNLGLAHERRGHLAQAAALMRARVDYEREIGHAQVEEHAARLEQLRQRIAGAPEGG